MAKNLIRKNYILEGGIVSKKDEKNIIPFDLMDIDELPKPNEKITLLTTKTGIVAFFGNGDETTKQKRAVSDNELKNIKSISKIKNDIKDNKANIETVKNDVDASRQRSELFGLNSKSYETYDQNKDNKFQMLALQKIDLNEIGTGAWQGISAKLDLYAQHGSYEGALGCVEFLFMRSVTGDKTVFDNWLVYATLKNTTNFTYLENIIQFSLAKDDKFLYIGICGKYSPVANNGIGYKIVDVRDMGALNLQTNLLINSDTPNQNGFHIVESKNITWLHNSNSITITKKWKNVEIVDHNSNPELRVGILDNENNAHYGKTYIQGMANNEFYHIDLSKIITKLPRKDIVDYSTVNVIKKLYAKTLPISTFSYNGIVYTQKIQNNQNLIWKAISWNEAKKSILLSTITLNQNDNNNVKIITTNVLASQINKIVDSVLQNELNQLIANNMPKKWRLILEKPKNNLNFLDIISKNPSKYHDAEFSDIEHIIAELEVGEQIITLPFIYKANQIGVDRQHYELFYKSEEFEAYTKFIFHIMIYDSGQVNFMVEARDLHTNLKKLPQVNSIVFSGHVMSKKIHTQNDDSPSVEKAKELNKRGPK